MIWSYQAENNQMRFSTAAESSSEQPENNWHARHLAFGLLFTAALSCVFLLSQYLSIEGTIVLTAFNVVFVSMTFPLIGSLKLKVALLLGCEIVGSLWMRTFSLLASRTDAGIAGVFRFLGPLVNLGWVIAFYSVTLTVLANVGRED